MNCQRCHGKGCYDTTTLGRDTVCTLCNGTGQANCCEGEQCQPVPDKLPDYSKTPEMIVRMIVSTLAMDYLNDSQKVKLISNLVSKGGEQT